MTTADLTAMSPVEIDTALAEIYSRYYRVQDDIARYDKWIVDMKDGIAKFEAGNHSYDSFTPEKLARLSAERTDLAVKAGYIMAESEPFEAEYIRRGGWTRFFLVNNSGGHIHSSMNCSTCYPTTRFGWLPNLSGQSEAEAVAAHGAILCTVCYPSAPTEWTDRHDDSVCAGSGKYLNRDLPHRAGYYSGNWATCEECGERITISKAGKIRKHKKGA